MTHAYLVLEYRAPALLDPGDEYSLLTLYRKAEVLEIPGAWIREKAGLPQARAYTNLVSAERYLQKAIRQEAAEYPILLSFRPDPVGVPGTTVRALLPGGREAGFSLSTLVRQATLVPVDGDEFVSLEVWRAVAL